MIIQTAHICIQTNNLRKTLDFYTEKLGLKLHFKFVKGRKTIGYYLDCGKKNFIEIFENEKAGTYDERSLIRHICFEVRSIKTLEASLTEKKVKHTEPKLGCDKSWQMWVKDPNGIPIEFHQYTRSSTQITGKNCIIPK